MESKVKGRVTIRIAAVFFVLSGILELTSLTGEVPFFGGVRGGAVASAYHLVYVVVFVGMGIGLWSAKRWGYWAVMIGTALYTLDKIQFLLARETLQSYFMAQLAASPEVLEFLSKEEILRIVSMIYSVFILCWWGFALYVHWRRAYFAGTAPAPM